jgi:tRNA nucleotidyltransferase/poly(A) polymerase
LEIAPATAIAIEAKAAALKGISPERIAEELRLMLGPPTRTATWQLLWKFKLAQVIFRFLPLKEDAQLNPSKSVFLATAPGAEIPFGLALAAAVLDAELQQGASDVMGLVSKKSIDRLAKAMDKALKLANVEFDQMAQSLAGVAMVLTEAPPSVAIVKRFLARETAGSSRHLLDALEHVGICLERIGALKKRFSNFDGSEVAPQPLITGDDLAAKGLVPGPVFKRILEEVYDAQLEGRVGTKEEAMGMAMGLSRGE